jgi:hypothetical protein
MQACSIARPWFEQMLETAFSRRMCCSRAVRVRTKPLLPSCVLGLADEAAGHLAHEGGLGAQHAEEGPAEAHGVAEGLALGRDDVGAELAGALQEAAHDRVGCYDEEGAGGVGRLRGRAYVAYLPREARIGRDHAEGEASARAAAPSGGSSASSRRMGKAET